MIFDYSMKLYIDRCRILVIIFKWVIVSPLNLHGFHNTVFIRNSGWDVFGIPYSQRKGGFHQRDDRSQCNTCRICHNDGYHIRSKSSPSGEGYWVIGSREEGKSFTSLIFVINCCYNNIQVAFSFNSALSYWSHVYFVMNVWSGNVLF